MPDIMLTLKFIDVRCYHEHDVSWLTKTYAFFTMHWNKVFEQVASFPNVVTRWSTFLFFCSNPCTPLKQLEWEWCLRTEVLFHFSTSCGIRCINLNHSNIALLDRNIEDTAGSDAPPTGKAHCSLSLYKILTKPITCLSEILGGMNF